MQPCISSQISPSHASLARRSSYYTLITLEMIIQSKSTQQRPPGPLAVLQLNDPLPTDKVLHRYHMGLQIYTIMWKLLIHGFSPLPGNRLMPLWKRPLEVVHLHLIILFKFSSFGSLGPINMIQFLLLNMTHHCFPLMTSTYFHQHHVAGSSGFYTE